MHFDWKIITTTIVLALMSGRRSAAAEPGDAPPAVREASPEIASPEIAPESKTVATPSFRERMENKTLGGIILWGDELFFHDWRIQRNALTGHCRLLDGENERHAWGTFEQCQEKLEEIRRERKLPPMSGRAVILIHGLGSVRITMTLLACHLEQHGYKVFNVTYPSTRGDLGQHAADLASIVARLDGIEEINFVGHSMGSLVIRHYLGDCNNPQSGRKPDPRLKRIVMIAPPNHGAEKAREWGDNSFFVAVVGAAGLQLGAGWESVEKKLAVPSCEFGIIAGGMGDDVGFSDTLPDDDDSVISVATTRLVGARDFVVLPCRHSLLLFNPTTAEYVCRFLDEGCFRSSEQRQPILAEKTQTEKELPQP